MWYISIFWWIYQKNVFLVYLLEICFFFFDKSLYQYVGISVVNSSAMTVSKYTLYHCKDSVLSFQQTPV